MKKSLMFYGLLLVSIVCMIIYLFNNDDESITKESRRYNYSIQLGLKKGEKFDINVASEIASALGSKKIWQRLFLSDKFKEKYKNPKGIIPNIKDYRWISGGNVPYEEFNKDNVIIIFADKKQPLFDFDDSQAIMTEFYFEYFMDENNDIDDIKLLKQVDTYASTGKPIEG